MQKENTVITNHKEKMGVCLVKGTIELVKKMAPGFFTTKMVQYHGKKPGKMGYV